MHPPSPWLAALRAAATAGDLVLARSSHALLTTSAAFSFSSGRFLANNLIAAYSKGGSLAAARQVFDQMPQRDSVSWNSLLAAYALHGHTHDAFLLLRLMRRSSIPPTRLTFPPVLKLCAESVDLLPMSQAVHGYAIRIGLELDDLVSSALVNVYAKFGFLDDARYLFNRMAERDVVLWNIMIKGYAQFGFAKDAFFMFAELHRSEGLRPNGASVSILAGREFDRDGEQVLAYGIKCCFVADGFDVSGWNKAMSEYLNAGESLSVLDSFKAMKGLDVGYDNVTLIIVLSAIASIGCLEVGEQIHGLALKQGFCIDVSVSNNLINLYSRMRKLDSARKVFKEMEQLDLVSWNSMIASCSQNGLDGEAIVHFMDMLRHGVVPDQFTLTSIARACVGMTRISSLHRQVHTFALQLGLAMDSFLLTALIDAYAKKRYMDEAKMLFLCMDWFDVVSCNALISGYVANEDNHSALELFSQVVRTGEQPDNYTLATVLKACSGVVGLEQGKQIHAQAIKLGLDSDLWISSALSDLYTKCGRTKDALALFTDISEPDSVAWTAIISGFVQNGEEERALRLYHQMRQLGFYPDEFAFASLIKACSILAVSGQGKQIHADAIKLQFATDDFVATSLMDMYVKSGNMEDSYSIFKRMSARSLTCWNVMVLGLAQHGNGEEALRLFERMKLEGVPPDKITFLGILSACSHSGLVSKAYGYFNSMHRDYGIEPEIEHYSCLVDALGRAGLVFEAENVIETMPFDASASMCRSLLSACRIQQNTEVGKRIAAKLLSLEPLDSSGYVLLSNIYATANQWDDAADARKRMKCGSMNKRSWLQMD